MDFILFSGITRQTGNSLAAEIGLRAGERLPNNANLQTLIRWGSSAYPELDEIASNVINRAVAVSLAANKFLSLEALSGSEIPVPKQIKLSSLQDQTLQAIAALGLNLPVLARQESHTRGRDILLCLQNKDISRAIRWGKTHITEYIPTKEEYRVHVFGGQVIKVSRKVLMSREAYVPYLRNDDNNHTYRNTRIKITDNQKQVAIDAVNALGLDFGAVDMVISDNDSPFVLEVNTGPSLIDSGIEIYSNKIREILEH